MRHFLFVYPPIVLLASGNLGLLFRKIRKRVVWLAVLLVLTAAGTYHPFLFHLRQHPNQVVYFNQLVGGIQGANGKYELDVWGNCYKQALDWLDMFCKKRGKPGRVTFILPPLKADDTLDSVVKEGKFSSTIPYVAQLRNLIYSPRPEQAEFFVSFLRGSPSYLKAIREWGHTLHETVVEKVPTCTVKKLYEDY
ncbi:MAG: hypothetical protein HY537_15325 [Deltaproteobacteria bacterium]|nr:hypothetical protein [Deltaproteobacteria bacterium]